MPYSADQESTYGVSLFERLEADAPSRSVINGPEPDDVMKSVKRNIGDILNARAGESLSTPDLGLIDFNDATAGSHDLAVRIKQEIHHCLETYEPRITDLEIKVLPDPRCPLNLRFSLTATLNTEAFHRQVQIDLLLDSARKYNVY